MGIAGRPELHRLGLAFGNQIDEQVKTNVSIPGTLMNQHALNYDAVQDRNSMRRLVGEEVVEAPSRQRAMVRERVIHVCYI